MSENLRRWQADWLAQGLWAIQNDHITLASIRDRRTPSTPIEPGLYDPKDGKIDTEIYVRLPKVDVPMGYHIFIPPLAEIDYPGEMRILTCQQVDGILDKLRTERHHGVWLEYEQGGPYMIFAWHASKSRVMPTTKAVSRPDMQRVAVRLVELVITQSIANVLK